MRHLLSVLAAAAVLVAASALAVEQFEDRELFVPPPEAVAEGFIREVITGRYSRAREYLQERESMSEDQLRALEQEIESRTGDPTEVEAETVTRDDQRALVTVRVSSAQGSHAMAYGLEFEEEWKIVR